MWFRRLQRIVEKNRNELAGVLLHRYPAFVWSDATPDRIPAFAFHGVTPSFLEPLLTYLAENQYITLTADEYAERSAAGERGGGREVLLTFDDGHISLYRVAFPVLKRLNQKAVAYIVPGRTPESSKSFAGQPEASALCTWTHIQEMHTSGVVDFQSHSMFHHSIATSSRIIDFFRPGLPHSFLASDLAPIIEDPDSHHRKLELEFGFPIHAWGARMGSDPAFQEQPALSKSCIEYVAANGGAVFFEKKNWRRLMRYELSRLRKKYPPIGFETPSSQKASILNDLKESKSLIQSKLPNKHVGHFCFPWFRGSALASYLSKEAGYISNAWASILPDFLMEADCGPISIARLPPKYIWRLPGTSRKSVSAAVRFVSR